MFFRKNKQTEATEPKPTKRPKPEPALEDDAPQKKRKKTNSKQEKKKKLAKEEDESGVVSDLSAEFPEVVSSPPPKEPRKKKKKAGGGSEATEESAPVSTSNDVPAKRKSKKQNASYKRFKLSCARFESLVDVCREEEITGDAGGGGA